MNTSQTQPPIPPTQSDSRDDDNIDTPATSSSTLTQLSMLEQRLHRLEFLLHGRTDFLGRAEAAVVPGTVNESVRARIGGLERGLKKLKVRDGGRNDGHDSGGGGVVRGLLEIYERYPELFGPAAEDSVPSTLDESVITSMVLAHGSTFSETVARLNLVKELPIPPATLSAKLVEIRPRLDQVREEQEEQLDRITDLRVRSARLLEHWLDSGVVGQGEVWSEYEERVRAVERVVKRIEIARAKEQRGL